MATIASLRIKAQWEKWLVEHSHQSPATPTPEATRSDRVASGAKPPVFNEILWMAVKREWRARLAAQQLPQDGQDVQGQDRD